MILVFKYCVSKYKISFLSLFHFACSSIYIKIAIKYHKGNFRIDRIFAFLSPPLPPFLGFLSDTLSAQKKQLVSESCYWSTGGAAVHRQFSLKHEDEKSMSLGQEDTLLIQWRLFHHMGEKQNS